MTKWKPAKKVPTIGNRPQHGLGQAQAAVVPILIRWGLPFVAWAGGAYLASLIVSKAVPDVPINKKNLGLASALVGGGMTSYFLAPTIADDWKPVAYAGAVAGVAAGLYFLFQEPPPAPPESPTGNLAKEEAPVDCKIPGNPRPNENMAPSLSGLRVDLDVEQGKQGGLKRNKWADQQYAFVVRNLTDDPKCFYVGLNIKDNNGAPITDAENTSFPNGTSSIGPSAYSREYVKLAPRETKSMVLTVPSLGAWYAAFTSFFTTVSVELFRNLRDTLPFQESNSIEVLQTTAWTAWMGVSQTAPLHPVEVHDEMNPAHVIGCKRCKGKKKKAVVFQVPTVPVIYPPSNRF